MTIHEKAIEQLERISSHLSAIGEKEDYTDIAIQALEQTRWIPVSKRLPDERKDCIVTFKDGYVDTMCYAPDLYKVDEFDFCTKKKARQVGTIVTASGDIIVERILSHGCHSQNHIRQKVRIRNV